MSAAAGTRPERARGRRRGWLPLAREKRVSHPPIRAKRAFGLAAVKYGGAGAAGRAELPELGSERCSSFRGYQGARGSKHAPFEVVARARTRAIGGGGSGGCRAL